MMSPWPVYVTSAGAFRSAVRSVGIRMTPVTRTVPSTKRATALSVRRAPASAVSATALIKAVISVNTASPRQSCRSPAGTHQYIAVTTARPAPHVESVLRLSRQQPRAAGVVAPQPPGSAGFLVAAAGLLAGRAAAEEAAATDGPSPARHLRCPYGWRWRRVERRTRGESRSAGSQAPASYPHDRAVDRGPERAGAAGPVPGPGRVAARART